MKRREKGEGFPGQRIAVLPRGVLARARLHPLLRGLLPTDVGYFPRASGHLRERSHGADQAIFIYCERGLGWCELAGTRHAVDAGRLLVIPPGQPHAYGADPAQPWSILWFHVQGELLETFLQELQTNVPQPVFKLAANSQFRPLFAEILDTMEHGYATHQLIYAAHTAGHLLAGLLREQHGPSPDQSDPAQRVARTIHYMREHLGQPLQLNTLAALAGLSRSRYVALFKQQAGYAPIDYFIRLRMHRACQLLDITQASVKAVAAELGYEDPLYFSRLFRMVNDVSPRQYRQARKG